MSRRSPTFLSLVLAAVLAALAVLGPAFCSPGTAGEWPPFFQKPEPEPRFYPAYVIPYDAYARSFGYAVPSYQWGYFGARRHPACSCSVHTGYHRNYVQWGWPARY